MALEPRARWRALVVRVVLAIAAVLVIVLVVLGSIVVWDILKGTNSGVGGHGVLLFDAIGNEKEPWASGAIIGYIGEDDLPQGWLECNGEVVPQAQYPKLHAHLTSVHLAKNGEVKLPDYRGMAIWVFASSKRGGPILNLGVVLLPPGADGRPALRNVRWLIRT